MKATIKVGIIGGAGYTGGELIRLLLHHPRVEISFVHSKSNAGNPVHQVHEDLLGSTTLQFTDSIDQNIDVLFLCLGHGESSKFLQENTISEQINIIDLANDFRLESNANFQNRKFVYGLPELNFQQIASAKNIANPGCFATAIQLGLLPLASKGLVNDVYTTAITGSTGAGQSLSATSHFSWRANNIQAYKTLTHQHLGEIHQSLHQLSSAKASVHFVPWRGDFTRGIFASSTLSSTHSIEQAIALYKEYYSEHPFTVVSEKQIALKQVINTNKAVIFLEQANDKLVVHTALDNLLKGASGQAVQNMNIMFGLEQTEGLQLKASAF
ncbi:MAG: N-acetyl-gamma-glutamyl-phosphate reductase [Chitinophagia bacterium]|jgi:N-acetyl-gamma-glutamyl-phosphate reductase|nr:N-acetyl-gamma-glutamyl-phosphate reductase [Chitinophagia bacterium]